MRLNKHLFVGLILTKVHLIPAQRPVIKLGELNLPEAKPYMRLPVNKPVIPAFDNITDKDTVSAKALQISKEIVLLNYSSDNFKIINASVKVYRNNVTISSFGLKSSLLSVLFTQQAEKLNAGDMLIIADVIIRGKNADIVKLERSRKLIIK